MDVCLQHLLETRESVCLIFRRDPVGKMGEAECHTGWASLPCLSKRSRPSGPGRLFSVAGLTPGGQTSSPRMHAGVLASNTECETGSDGPLLRTTGLLVS